MQSMAGGSGHGGALQILNNPMAGKDVLLSSRSERLAGKSRPGFRFGGYQN